MPDIDAQYRAGIQSGQLLVQQCSQCEALRFPPSPTCPHCLFASDERIAVSGRATVWSWIRMHKQYFADSRREPPYNVAMIQLEEGPLMISAIVDEPAELTCGAAVSVVFEGDGDQMLPWFRLDPVAEASDV